MFIKDLSSSIRCTILLERTEALKNREETALPQQHSPWDYQRNLSCGSIKDLRKHDEELYTRVQNQRMYAEQLHMELEDLSKVNVVSIENLVEYAQFAYAYADYLESSSRS